LRVLWSIRGLRQCLCFSPCLGGVDCYRRRREPRPAAAAKAICGGKLSNLGTIAVRRQSAKAATAVDLAPNGASKSIAPPPFKGMRRLQHLPVVSAPPPNS